MVALAKTYSLKDFRNKKAGELARLDQLLAFLVKREMTDEDVRHNNVYTRDRIVYPAPLRGG